MSFLIGKEGNKDIILPLDKRLQNTVVYGASGSGKSRYLYMHFAKEQLEDRTSGATFICGKGNQSWLLERLARKHNRDVVFLHPDSDKGTNEYLKTDFKTGLETQKHLIDYVDAMKNNKIVIVDFDLARTRKKGKDAMVKFLYHLQRAMVENSDEHPHFVYIDDAEPHLRYLQDLITYGINYSVGTFLFLSSYSLLEVKSRELAYFLNTYCMNTITMNRLSPEDFSYFSRRFYGEVIVKDFKRRERNELVAELIIDGKLEVITIQTKYMNKKLLSELEEEANTTKRKRGKRKHPRKRGVVEKKQTEEDIKHGFSNPPRMGKVFVSEEEYLGM